MINRKSLQAAQYHRSGIRCLSGLEAFTEELCPIRQARRSCPSFSAQASLGTPTFQAAGRETTLQVWGDVGLCKGLPANLCLRSLFSHFCNPQKKGTFCVSFTQIFIVLQTYSAFMEVLNSCINQKVWQHVQEKQDVMRGRDQIKKSQRDLKSLALPSMCKSSPLEMGPSNTCTIWRYIFLPYFQHKQCKLFMSVEECINYPQLNFSQRCEDHSSRRDTLGDSGLQKPIALQTHVCWLDWGISCWEENVAVPAIQGTTDKTGLSQKKRHVYASFSIMNAK